MADDQAPTDPRPVYRPRRALPPLDDDADIGPDDGPDDAGPDGDDAEPAVRPRRAIVLLDPDVTVQEGAPQPPGPPAHDAVPLAPGPDTTTDPDTTNPDTTSRPARRRRIWIGAVAAAVVVALALGYSGWALLTGHNPVAAAERLASAPPSAPPLLPDRQMLDAQTARPLDPAGTWTIASDARGTAQESAAAICLAGPATGEAAPQATRIRTLTAGGATGPAVLHQADEYASAEQATQVLTARAHALGGCATPGALITTGWVGANLGDQAVGVTVLLQPTKTLAGAPQYHTVLLNRTGRIVNVLDVAAQGKPVPMPAVAKALGSITDRQCTSAVGLCATDASVHEAVPPVGNAVPGFPNLADIPRVSGSDASWTPGEPTRTPQVTGTDCEGVDVSSVKGATATEARTYILGDHPDAPFGFDTVLITMPSAKDARALSDKISANLTGCAKRVLTAQVSAGKAVSGSGVDGAAIAGRTFEVTQKVNKGKTSYRYRVGVAGAGDKVVYLFANPTKDEDFTSAQWSALTLRAAQRATQIN